MPVSHEECSLHPTRSPLPGPCVGLMIPRLGLFMTHGAAASSLKGENEGAGNRPARIGFAGQAAAARHVSAELIAFIAVVGTPLECRERVEACRRSGIALPIVNPRPTGTDPKQAAIEALQACAL
jgi:hypothetical protein